MISLLERVHRHRTEIAEIAARYRASNARVFGSVARGESTAESDIDLLFDFDDQASLFDQFRLQRALSALLTVKVDVASSRGLKPRVREALLSAAIPV